MLANSEKKVKKETVKGHTFQCGTPLVPATKLEDYVGRIDPGVDPVYGLENPSFEISSSALKQAQIEVDKFVHKIVRNMVVIGEKGENRFKGRQEVVIRAEDILRMISKKRLRILLEPEADDLEISDRFLEMKEEEIKDTGSDKSRPAKRTKRGREDINPLLWA